jgi:hypothetical protein
MIDPTAVPVLIKALDWLFGEGSKILQEHRERRKAQQGTTQETDKAITPAGAASDIEIIQSREDALKQPITKNAWTGSEARVKHLLSLLDIYTKNYYLAKEEYAKWGSALVPPIIVHNLTEAEDNISVTTKELETILSNAYEKRVGVPEVE